MSEGVQQYRFEVIYQHKDKFWSKVQTGIMLEGDTEQLKIEVPPHIDSFTATFERNVRQDWRG